MAILTRHTGFSRRELWYLASRVYRFVVAEDRGYDALKDSMDKLMYIKVI